MNRRKCLKALIAAPLVGTLPLPVAAPAVTFRGVPMMTEPLLMPMLSAIPVPWTEYYATHYAAVSKSDVLRVMRKALAQTEFVAPVQG